MDGRTDGHVIHISGRIFDNDLIAKWTICVKRLFFGGGGGGAKKHKNNQL